VSQPAPQPAPQNPDDSPKSATNVPALEVGAEWLRGEGELSDVLLSSRVRLARNLAGRLFATKATRRDRQETLDVCREWLMRAELASKMIWVDLHGSSPLDRALLVERHLISKNHSKGKGTNPNEDPRGVAISVPDERLSIMINEEDHLRIQAIRSGLSLSQAWADIDSVDDKIESKLDYAFSPRFGYLTACPTNVGTGVRMSAMLHLPALRLTGELEKVKRAAQDMSLAVRGFYGEGSEAVGDLFQISNQTTLGKSEQQILQDLEGDILPKVVEYERLARRELLAKRRVGLEDQVWRAWGALSNARLMNTDEAMQALSLVRLGATMGLLRGASGTQDSPDPRTINQLMLLVQPAHLQRAVGRELDQEQRRVARASLLRSRLLRPKS
jgi:protein arginine kinase